MGEGIKSVKNNLFPLLHAPYKNAHKLESTLTESKLGKLECEGVDATENRDGLDCSYQIRLNEKSPFGVVMLRFTLEAMQRGKRSGAEPNLTLSDFGTDANSALPDSK